MRGFCLVGILLLLSWAVAGASYVHGADGLLAKVNDTGIYYYHSDNLGSTSAVTNEAGELVSEQNYLPFGEEFLQGGDSIMYEFTGKEFDSDIGLNYFGARYYNPEIGRFLTIDSVKDGINWYSYVSNNPLKFVDPTGNEKEPVRPTDYDKAYPIIGGRMVLGGDIKDQRDVPLHIFISSISKRKLKSALKIKHKVVKDKNKYYKGVLTDDFLKNGLIPKVNKLLGDISGNEFSVAFGSVSRGDESKIPYYRAPRSFFEKYGIKVVVDPTRLGWDYEKGGVIRIGAHHLMALASDKPIHVTILEEFANGYKRSRERMILRGALIWAILEGVIGPEHPQPHVRYKDDGWIRKGAEEKISLLPEYYSKCLDWTPVSEKEDTPLVIEKK